MAKQLKPLTWAIAITILIAAGSFAARVPAAAGRGISGNEAITLLSLSGHAMDPVYPHVIEPVQTLRAEMMDGSADFSVIAQELKSSDGHPPTYSWTLSLWTRIFGNSLPSARMLSNLAASVLILLIGVVFAKRLDLVSLALLELTISFSSVLDSFGTEARSYMICLTLIVALIATAVRAADNSDDKVRQLRWVFATGLIGGVGIFTHYLLALPALAVGLWLLFELRKTSAKNILINGASFTAPVLGLGLMARTYYEAQKSVHDSNRPGYMGLVSDLQKYGRSFERALLNDAHSLPVVAVELLFVVIAISVLTAEKTKEQIDQVYLSILVMLSSLLGVMALNYVTVKHLYAYRYFVFVVPGLWLLMGTTLSLPLKPWLRRAMLTTLFFALVLELGGFNWKGAPIGKLDYTQSDFTEPSKHVLETGGAKTLVLIEHTPERQWPIGLISQLALVGNFPTLVIPKGSDAIAELTTDAQLKNWPVIWYLVNDDQSEAARLRFEKQTPSGFRIAEHFSWGYRLVRNPQ